MHGTALQLVNGRASKLVNKPYFASFPLIDHAFWERSFDGYTEWRLLDWPDYKHLTSLGVWHFSAVARRASVGTLSRR